MHSSRMRTVRCSSRLLGEGVCLLGGCRKTGGVCSAQGVSAGGGWCLPGGGCLPRGVYTSLLWTKFLTHACENITFPQFRLRTVINIHFDICMICLYTGITLTKKINKLGMRSSDTAQLFFEDVRVSAKNIIGDEGLGFMYQMMQFQEERLWAAAASKSGKIVYA